MWEEMIDKELDRLLWKMKKFGKILLNPVIWHEEELAQGRQGGQGHAGGEGGGPGSG